VGDVVETKQQAIFKKDHELKKILGQLKKVSKKAIETLEAGLTSDDERVRMIAAEKLLKFYVDTANEINADELKRLLLEVKASGLIGAGSTASQDDDSPALDFDNISEEFRDVPVIDMSNVNKI
jgi:hypothetical protein